MDKKERLLGCLVLVLILGMVGCGTPSVDSGEKSSEGSGKSHFLLSKLWQQLPEEVKGQKENAASPVEQGQSYDGYFLEEGDRYWYHMLSLAERTWYADMENILGSMTQKGELSKEGLESGLTEEHIDHVFQCVMMDHPELFFVDGYVYSIDRVGERISRMTFSGTYSVSREEAIRKKREIEESVALLLEGAPRGMDDYAKIKYVYEALIRQTDYNPVAPDDQNIYSVFVGKGSVCQGYAKATQYLLNRLDVPCTLVSGTVQGGSRHGWNLVLADGEYYYVDTTWGDASYQSLDGEKKVEPPIINYDYLCVTTEELTKTHHLDEGLLLPECTSIRDNYFVREGAYFTELDKEKLKELFSRVSGSEWECVTLKCASLDVFLALKRYLISEENIFQCYDRSVVTVVYVQNEEQYSLTFWVTNSKKDDIMK